MKVKISVIIPTYNRKEMLKEAIDSVLKQTKKAVEILVIDDNSSDGTENMLEREYGGLENLTVLRNESNRQAGYNRNLGYNQAKGEYLVFFDDDDYYTDTDFFKKALAVHESGDYAFVGANSTTKYEDLGTEEVKPLNRKGLVDRQEYLKGFMTAIKKPNSTFTALFKRSKLEKIGFAEMKMMNDGPIYMRALLTGDGYLMEDVIGVYRIHRSNISFSLNLDFLLENLDEKIWVGNEAMKLGYNGIDQAWINGQVMHTLNYYITHSKPNQQKRQKVMMWLKENLPDQIGETRRLMLKIKGKSIARKLLGRKEKL